MDVVDDDFVETQYYNQLSSIDKQHHTVCLYSFYNYRSDYVFFFLKKKTFFLN